MNSDHFWITFWGIIAAVLITLIAVVGFNNVNSTNKIAEMVAAGADPIRTRCAMTSDVRYINAVCSNLE